MSDDPDLAEMADDTPTEAAEVEATTPPPWGDDFNPERAWKTITTQRDRERELEPDAKAFQRLRSGEDMDTFRELAAHYGYELDEEDPTELDAAGDPYAPKFAEVEKTQQQLVEFMREQQQERRMIAFHTQIDNFAEKHGVEASEKDRKYIAALADIHGGDSAGIEAAIKEHYDYVEGLTRNAVDARVKSKNAPRVQSSGKEATQVPDLDDPETRRAFILERMQAHDQGT